jgi:hypothetical protein
MRWKLLVAALFIVSACLLVHAGLDEWTGEAVASGGRGAVEKAMKATQPERFRQLMNYQWVVAGLWLAASFLVARIIRNQESLNLESQVHRAEPSRENP